MPKTLIRIFMDACARPKPALFMRHAERGWESITPARALAGFLSKTLDRALPRAA